MSEYECVLDFSNDDFNEEDRQRFMSAIKNGKKIKTTIKFSSDGDLSGFHFGENWEISAWFNTNTSVGLGQDMGMTMNYGEYSKEDIAEIEKDLKENGPDDSYNDYLKSSKDDFLD